MKHQVRDFAIVGVTAALMLLTNLGSARLWDRDEPRNAGCAAEMLARGDWVTPVFNHELRAHKPVLLYWLIMSAYTVFGVNEFAARFWSAIIGIATCLATYDLARRMFDRTAGCWAGVILSTCLAFDLAARAATPDSALIGCTTFALWVFVRTTFPDVLHTGGHSQMRSMEWRPAAIMYGFMGLGVLAKGPVGCVLPTMILVLFVWLLRRVTDRPAAATRSWRHRCRQWLRAFAPGPWLSVVWSLRPLTGLFVILAVAAPWYVWVGQRTDGEFLREFFLEHNFGRAASAREGHHGPFLVYYVVALLVGFFPWSVFATPVTSSVIRAVRERHPWSQGYIFLACWVAVYVVLFSFAQTKLPNYVAPCYPALAVLTGCWLRKWTIGECLVSRGWLRAALATLACVGSGWMILWPTLTRTLFPGEAPVLLLGAFPLLGAILMWRESQRGRPRVAASWFAVAAGGFVLGLFAVVVPRVDQHQQYETVLRPIREADGQAQVVVFGLLEPSWVFYSGRPIRNLAATNSRRTLGVRDFFEDGEDRFLLATDRHWEQLQRKLPEHVGIVAECPLFLKPERLLLIGVMPSDRQASRSSATTRTQ